MNRTQYAAMLQKIHETKTNGGDVKACIAEFQSQYKYAYIFNDSIFKRIFGSPANKGMAASFLNAVLKLEGEDCISISDFVDPSVPGGPFVKSITSDIVATDQKSDRIVIEMQHKGDSTFKDRLVFYTACHTVQNKLPGASYKLRKVNYIALQMFDAYSKSSRYRHTVLFKNEDNEIFSDKETLTIVELKKFYDGCYDMDESRLAMWLRAVNWVNGEHSEDLPGNPYVKDLQKSALLCNFDIDFLVTEAKAMSDRIYELEIERKEARAEARAEALVEGRIEGHAEGRAEGLVEGRAEGRVEGRAEGRVEGRAEGRVEGRAEGLLKAAQNMARKMLAKNKPITEIAEFTELSESEILALNQNP